MIGRKRILCLDILDLKGKRRFKAYREFVEAGKDLGQRPELVGGGLIRSKGGWSQVLSLRKKGESEANDERILGDGDFVQGILEEADQRLTRQIRARKKAGTLSKIIKDKCREAEINEVELRSGSQRRAVTGVRRRLCYYLCRDLGLPMAEVARQIGIGTTGVAMAIKGIEAAHKIG
jgi:putative transposase